ncbi:MAG: tRNA pseudouridine(38-40) synthase TruA [Bryobacteraceae bacterium]
MATWKLLLEYDGGRYSGWQEQPNARTVQGELRKAAEDFFGVAVDLQGAGRTDAGVHARGQVAHLRVQARKNASPPQLVRALNEVLPADIVVLEAAIASPRFHARHDALTRCYVYQISTRKSAFAKRYVWWVKEPLDIELMSRAAALLVGRHDFTAFRALDPSKPDESTIVVVESADLVRDQHLILFRMEASHFIWRMVRRVVGVLVKLGKHEVTLRDLEKLLSGRTDPKLDVAAWTAPASGLFLDKVNYPAV